MSTVPLKMSADSPPDRPDIAAAFAAFDAANGKDPNREGPKGEANERLYGRRMSAWLERLYPEASASLRLAARCQHIERWKIPRKAYPEGRIGYLTWRRDLKRFHADRAAEILAPLGFDEVTIDRVGRLLRKEQLSRDPEAQALEDVVCAVFLVHHLADFALQHDRAKVVDILRKTWRKMSPYGRAAALTLDLPPDCAELIRDALAGGEDRRNAVVDAKDKT